MQGARRAGGSKGAAGAGLGQGVGRAERQRLDGRLGPFLAERGDDQHPGAAAEPEDFGKHVEPAGARHFDVEQDDIDLDLAERVERLAGVARQRGHLEFLVA